MVTIAIKRTSPALMRGRLAEEKFVDAAFVSGGQALDHGHQTNSDREKRGEHQPEGGVFLQPCRLLDQTNYRGPDKPAMVAPTKIATGSLV